MGAQTRLGQKTNIRRFLLLVIKLQCFVVFVYYQGSCHIPSCFTVLAKNTENALAFGVEGAKGRDLDTA